MMLLRPAAVVPVYKNIGPQDSIFPRLTARLVLIELLQVATIFYLGFARWWDVPQLGQLSRGVVMDEELVHEQVQVERKLFSFSLKQNPRGRFLKITEDVAGRRDMIIIPSTGLEQVKQVLERMINADRDAGPPPGQPE